MAKFIAYSCEDLANDKPVSITTQVNSPVGGARAQAHTKLIFDSTLSIIHPAHEMMITNIDNAIDSEAQLVDAKVKNQFLLLISTIFVSIVSTGCLYYPVANNKNAFSDICIISTPSWKLEHEIVNYSGGCNGEDALECLAAWGIIIPTGSFVVSGSIYVIGNTVHWLEYQGVCSDSELRKAFSKLNI